MSEFTIILQQLVQFMIILFLGFLMARLNILTNEILPNLSKLISKLLLPAYIFINTVGNNSLDDLLKQLPVILIAAIIYFALPILYFLISKALRLKNEHSKIFQALFVYGNIGFIGIPLILSLYPKEGGLYVALISVVDQISLWTYGLYLTSGNSKPKLKNFFNPAMAAIVLAILLIVFAIPLPVALTKTMSSLGNSAGCICMLYLGASLYFIKPYDVLKCKELYIGILSKMLILPIALGYLLNQTALAGSIKGTIILLCSLPTMTVIPMLVPETSSEKRFAVGGSLITILCSLITIPIVAFLVM